MALAILHQVAFIGREQQEMVAETKVSGSTWWKAMRDPFFLDLLADARKQTLGRERDALTHLMISDAMLSIRDRKRHGVESDVIFRARVQACAFLGIKTQPDTVVAGQVGVEGDIRHQHEHSLAVELAEFPTAIVAMFGATGMWPAKDHEEDDRDGLEPEELAKLLVPWPAAT